MLRFKRWVEHQNVVCVEDRFVVVLVLVLALTARNRIELVGNLLLVYLLGLSACGWHEVEHNRNAFAVGQHTLFAAEDIMDQFDHFDCLNIVGIAVEEVPLVEHH